jgi:hypothetical protein
MLVISTPVWGWLITFSARGKIKCSVKLPPLCRIAARQVGAQQVVAFAAHHLAQFVFPQREGEGLGADHLVGRRQLQCHQVKGPARFLLGAAQFEEQFVAGQTFFVAGVGEGAPNGL